MTGDANRRARPSRRFLVSAASAGIMFALYWQTLLPGLDLGDTASFQAIAGSPVLNPRHAYPLYFAIGNLFLAASAPWGVEPAFALNLASAVCGALACGAICLVGVQLTGSPSAGLFAGLLFGSSYTFWSQAVIAEVYALHMLAMGLSIALVLHGADRPSARRLAAFFLTYALSFGNHLSSILFLPGFALFLLLEGRGHAQKILRPQVIFLALAMAALGALQYGWNVYGMLTAPDGPATFAEAVQTFWFDVSKSDWRESMVGMVPAAQVPERAAMAWFDLRQQFGVFGVLVAAMGMAVLFRTKPRTAAMLLTHYLVAFVFAFTYNVGDTHVFFLPAHLILAVCTAPAVAAVVGASRLALATGGTVVMAIVLAYPIWRIYDTLPAVDRSSDRRALDMVRRFAGGLSPNREVLGTGLPWDLQNAVDYYVRRLDPALVTFRIPDVLPHFPFLVRDNDAIGRDVLLAGSAAAAVEEAYGDLFEIDEDTRLPARSFAERMADVRRGTPYVLAVLAPDRRQPLDRADLDRAARALSLAPLPPGDYVVIAGLAGTRYAEQIATMRPCRRRLRVKSGNSAPGAAGEFRVDIRIESWLGFDTIRRAGFGHVIVNGRHALTIERGVSFVELDLEGRPVRFDYAGNAFAPLARQVIRARFARGAGGARFARRVDR